VHTNVIVTLALVRLIEEVLELAPDGHRNNNKEYRKVRILRVFYIRGTNVRKLHHSGEALTNGPFTRWQQVQRDCIDIYCWTHDDVGLGDTMWG
jgi:hypothetical protein